MTDCRRQLLRNVGSRQPKLHPPKHRRLGARQAGLLSLAILRVVTPVPAPAATAKDALPLSSRQLFDFADRARDAGNFGVAAEGYRALATNPNLELRTEAHFRLGMMLADREHKYSEAAVEFRAILDEKPNAVGVRLELARMQALLGNIGAAERELRAVQASGLPPEVEQMVRFYARALSDNRAFGGSIELALAPDNNINRATRSSTLGTVLGNFTLNDDAKARSGLGFTLRGQGYARAKIGTNTRLLARLSESANVYRKADFNDIAIALQAGPEFQFGGGRITLSAGPAWRWYGMHPYTTSYGLSIDLLHPLTNRSQLHAGIAANRSVNHRDDLQTGNITSGAIGIDQAFSSRFGGGFQLSAIRTTARDPGFADVTVVSNAYLFREFGHTTLVVAMSYARLEADARLPLFLKRRTDDRYAVSATTTFRALRVGSLAPFARLRLERNFSTIGIYNFKRLAGELGLSSAF